MIHRTASGCCERDIGSSKAHVPQTCDHGELLVYVHGLKRGAPMRRVSAKREKRVRRQGSTMKPGKGMAASKAQQEKVRGLPCAGCGAEESEYVAIDPAHLWPRSQCPCDHAEGVVPLCRTADGGCHRTYDSASTRASLRLDEKLLTRGYYEALAHPIAAHEVSPLSLLQHVSGQKWMPVESPHETKGAASAALGRSS